MEEGLISVDRWRNGSQAYFLTHLHSDHTQGLTSTWNKGPLFCSRLTFKLFPFKFRDFNFSLIRVLDLGEWHSLSLISPSTGSRVSLQVMAIDAHHCPGAVMFLFRGEFGCSLYTGDFRWETDCERANVGRTMLLDALQDDVVDIVYLDNTYCNPSYAFPSRDVAAQQVVDIITSHPDHEIIIAIDSLGKEDLLLHISRALNIKIWVWPERLQTMHILGFHDHFTTKTSLTRVRAVPRYSFSIDTLEGLNTMRPTVGVMPSGLPWVLKPVEGDEKLLGSLLTSRYYVSKLRPDGVTQTDDLNCNSRSVERLHEYIYSVQYSDHSCFAEIQEFIKLVEPSSIKGIVSPISCCIDPLFYFGRLCGVNQSSNKNQKKEGSKRVVTVTDKPCFRTGGSIEVNKKRKRVSNCLEIHQTRVQAVRRLQRGVRLTKLPENDSSE